jgi:hypothetical protein
VRELGEIIGYSHGGGGGGDGGREGGRDRECVAVVEERSLDVEASGVLYMGDKQTMEGPR